MRQSPHHLMVCCLTVFFALTLSGCAPSSPEEKIAAARAQYTVRLENFTVQESVPEPMPAEEAGAEAVAGEAAAAASEEMMEGEMMEGEMMEGEMMEGEMIEESGPRTATVILHLLVRFNGAESLPGITVEVTQADPFGKEDAPTLHYLETAGMTKSEVRQLDLEIPDVEFEDGDAFSVILRTDVPAEKRGDYREFAATP